jgi:hypothetical protein
MVVFIVARDFIAAPSLRDETRDGVTGYIVVGTNCFVDERVAAHVCCNSALFRHQAGGISRQRFTSRFGEVRRTLDIELNIAEWFPWIDPHE